MTAASGADRVLVAACEGVSEPDGAPCTGLVRYRWGQIEAACDTCGGRCGVAVALWLRVESPASGADQPTPATWDHRPHGGGYCVCGQPIHTAVYQPTLRDQLAAWLCNEDERAPAWEFCEDDDRDYWRRKADRLLPLIEADRERAKAEGGAEALEQAARIALPASGVRGLLLDRAAALRGSTGGAG